MDQNFTLNSQEYLNGYKYIEELLAKKKLGMSKFRIIGFSDYVFVGLIYGNDNKYDGKKVLIEIVENIKKSKSVFEKKRVTQILGMYPNATIYQTTLNHISSLKNQISDNNQNFELSSIFQKYS